MPTIKKKLYYKIGEVYEMTGIQPHVLRYWESEFPFLNPKKNKAGQRLYQLKDIELISTIKRLLYNEKFTIAGARRKMKELIKEENKKRAFTKNKELTTVIKERDKILRSIKNDLSEIKKALQRLKN